jgi:hypothetical protein
MTLNIPVPIPELQRTGDLSNESLFVIERNNVTHHVNWSRLLSLFINIPDSIIFGYGSVELPAISFEDSFSGFYAPQLGSVAVSTDHTRKLFVGPSGVIEFGDVNKKDTTVTTIKSESTTKCDVRFLQNFEVTQDLILHADIDLNGLINFDDVTIDGDGDGGDLTVLGGYVKFGTDCDQTLNSYNRSRFYCNVISEKNITIVGDINNHLTTFNTTITTNDFVVSNESTFNTITTPESIQIDDGGTISLDKDGDVTTSGDVTADKIFGDGQGLINLNLPNSLRLKGSIDPTTQGPGTPQHGDVWYSTTTGNFTNDWVGLEGQDVRVGQSFYYFQTPTPKWVLGALTDLQSPYFMLVDLDQEVTGDKTHNALIIAENTIDVGSSNIVANNLVLTGKAESSLTVSGNPGTTLTTKSYVDARMINTTLDFPLSTSKYIIGQSYNGSSARTWDLDASPVGTDNLVVRNDLGNFSANQITSTFLNGVTTDAKTLDVKFPTSDSEHPVTLVTSTGLSQLVYCDNDFTYNPVTDTLSVDYFIGDITGDVTGNADTFTAFETPRLLWGQTFDATEDVDGDLIDVGNFFPSGTESSNLGSANNVWDNFYALTFYGTLEGSVTVGDSLREVLQNGSHILGGDWFGADFVTWSVDCDSDTVNGKIVVRDELGSFNSNVISANEFVGPLTGNVTGNVSGSSSSVTGNAATTTKFETSRTLWTQSFDGTQNVDGNIELTGHIRPSQTSTFDLGSSSLPYERLYVDFIDGDIPNNTTSTDKVNGPLGRGNYIEGSLTEWDGSEIDTWSVDPRSENIPNKTVLRGVGGNFRSGTITATFRGDITGDVTGNASGVSSSVTGNAATTTRLQTTRTLWGQTFDGRQNVSGTLTTTGNVIPEVTDTSIFGREDKKFRDVYAETFHGYFQDNVTNVDRLVGSLSTGNYITPLSDWDGSTDVYWNVFAASDNVNNSVVLRNSSGNVIGSTITSHLSGPVIGNVTGNVSGSSSSVTGAAATSTKLEIQREIRITISGTIAGSGVLRYDGTSEVDMIAEVETELSSITIDNLAPLPE